MSQKDLSVVQNGENNIFISNEKNVNINGASGTSISVSEEGVHVAENVKVAFGEEQLSLEDANLLNDFRRDYDNLIVKCIKTDYTVPGINIDFPDIIDGLYSERWDVKSLKTRNKVLRKLVLDTLQALNELSGFMSDKYMRIIEDAHGNCSYIPRNESLEQGDRLRDELRPKTNKLRYKLRDLYRELHPEDYEGIPPFEDYCEE